MCFGDVPLLSTMEEHTPVKQIKEVKLSKGCELNLGRDSEARFGRDFEF